MWALPQEAAKAAAGLEEAQCQLAQHGAAVEEARKLQADACAALVSLGLRCEDLAETLAAERGARQVITLADVLPNEVQAFAHELKGCLLPCLVLCMMH